MSSEALVTYRGGCHCSRVRFHLLSGADDIVEHTFNTGVAKHRFCGTCGIKSFYVPRSNPDGIDVNVRCLDEGCVVEMVVEAFDVREWEANAAALSHLSEA